MGLLLLPSGGLNAELEALGIDASIFGDVLLPAPRFLNLVPRRAGVWDTAPNTYGFGDFDSLNASSDNGFYRPTDALYRDGAGRWQSAGKNVIRPHHDANGNACGLLFERTTVNRCENYNANPDAGLTNLTTGGGTETLTRVADAASIAEAKLENVCTDGNLIELDGGASGGYVTVQGITEADDTVVSVFAKMVNGTGELTFSGAGVPTPVSIGSTLARHTLLWASATAGRSLQISVGANAVCRFCLNQLETDHLDTSPIVTTGATATRQTDELILPLADWQSEALLNSTVGTAVVQVVLTHAVSDLQPASGGRLWELVYFTADRFLQLAFLPASAIAVLAANKSDSNETTSSIDISGWPTGEPCLLAAWWNQSTGKMQLGTKTGGTWTWSAENALFHELRGLVDRFKLGAGQESNVKFWDRALTVAQIQDLYANAAN